jgi:hypothetical protein
MPAAKPAAKKTTSNGTSMQKWDAEMAKYAQQQEEQQQAALGGGNFIGTRGGVFSYKKEVLGKELDVVIADSVFENDYYEGEFDADNPRPPVCFAFGRDPKTMAPHPDSVDPQNADCKSCRHNVMGTAIKGKGKRCKNVQRHALITEDMIVSADKLAKAEVIYLKTPVTSGQGFAKYSVETTKRLHRPLFGVVTHLEIVNHPKYQFVVEASLKEEINDGSVFGELINHHEAQKAGAIEFPYMPPSEEPAPAAKAPASRKFSKATGKAGKR